MAVPAPSKTAPVAKPAKLEDMATMVANTEAPIFILGGPKKDSEDEAVQYAAMTG